MAQVNKSSSKKSNVANMKKGTTQYTLKAWHIVAGLVLFIAGGFIVAYSQAATETIALEKSEPIIFYQDNDTSAQIEKINDVPVQNQGPKIIQLSAEGDLYCFDKNTDNGANRKMSPQEITNLLNELQTANITQPPTPSAALAGVNAKSITYTNPTTHKAVSINLLQTNESTPSITKAVSSLDKACSTNNKPTKRLNVPLRSSRRAVSQNYFSVNQVAARLVGTAQAAATQANYASDFSAALLNLIQSERTKHGLPAFAVHPCLNRSGVDWSSQMAVRYNSVTQSTGTYPKDYIIWHSNLAAEIEPFCGKQWTKLGENVGNDSASALGVSAAQAAQSMFNNYMNSQLHRNQILGNTTYIGVGSTLTANQATILNTTHFASGTLFDLRAPASK